MSNKATAAANAAALAPAPMPAFLPVFVKVDAGGLLLPDSAEAWDAVYERVSGLMFAARLPTQEKEWPERASILHGFSCAGFSDWRVATAREVLWARDDSRFKPAFDPKYFQFPEYGWIWTDTPWAADPESSAWGVYLGSGHAYDDHQGDEGLVLPVRGPVPSPGQS